MTYPIPAHPCHRTHTSAPCRPPYVHICYMCPISCQSSKPLSLQPSSSHPLHTPHHAVTAITVPMQPYPSHNISPSRIPTVTTLVVPPNHTPAGNPVTARSLQPSASHLRLTPHHAVTAITVPTQPYPSPNIPSSRIPTVTTLVVPPNHTPAENPVTASSLRLGRLNQSPPCHPNVASPIPNPKSTLTVTPPASQGSRPAPVVPLSMLLHYITVSRPSPCLAIHCNASLCRNIPPCLTMPHHIIPHHASPSCLIMSHHAPPCLPMLNQASSCLVMPRHAPSCLIKPQHVSPCLNHTHTCLTLTHDP